MISTKVNLVIWRINQYSNKAVGLTLTAFMFQPFIFQHHIFTKKTTISCQKTTIFN